MQGIGENRKCLLEGKIYRKQKFWIVGERGFKYIEELSVEGEGCFGDILNGISRNIGEKF